MSLVAFVVRELTATSPVVNLRLFRQRTFASATVIAGILYAMLMASMFLLPVFMQELLGFDAMQSGLALMPRTLAMIVLMPVVGRLYNRVPPAILVGVGILLFVVGSYQLSHLTLQSSSADIVVPLVVTGFGFACLIVPLTTVALQSMERAVLADAAGLNSFVRQIGGSFGLTIFATLLTSFGKQAYSSISANVTLYRPEVVEQLRTAGGYLMSRGMDPVAANQAAIQAMAGRVLRQADVLGFEKVFVLQALVFVFVLPLVVLLRADGGRIEEHVEMSLEA
jgi:DHA2 family multidrug resistance protein